MWLCAGARFTVQWVGAQNQGRGKEGKYCTSTCDHRNQTISRKGANIISRRPSHGHLARRCCPQAFLRILSEVTYIRTVGNCTLLKIYTLPNHTITIGVCILETQLLGVLYGGGASFVQKWSMPWMSANILYRSLFYIVWFLCLWPTHTHGALTGNYGGKIFRPERRCVAQNIPVPLHSLPMSKQYFSMFHAHNQFPSWHKGGGIFRIENPNVQPYFSCEKYE
jgi:hypothetical protein